MLGCVAQTVRNDAAVRATGIHGSDDPRRKSIGIRMLVTAVNGSSSIWLRHCDSPGPFSCATVGMYMYRYHGLCSIFPIAATACSRLFVPRKYPVHIFRAVSMSSMSALV